MAQNKAAAKKAAVPDAPATENPVRAIRSMRSKLFYRDRKIKKLETELAGLKANAAARVQKMTCIAAHALEAGKFLEAIDSPKPHEARVHSLRLRLASAELAEE